MEKIKQQDRSNQLSFSSSNGRNGDMLPEHSRGLIKREHGHLRALCGGMRIAGHSGGKFLASDDSQMR